MEIGEDHCHEFFMASVHRVSPSKKRRASTNDSSGALVCETENRMSEVTIDYNDLSQHISTLDADWSQQGASRHAPVNLFDMFLCKANDTNKLKSSEHATHDNKRLKESPGPIDLKTKHGCSEISEDTAALKFCDKSKGNHHHSFDVELIDCTWDDGNLSVISDDDF